MNTKKLLFSNSVSGNAASLSALLQRLVFGGFMLVGHGWPKLMSFSDRADSFADPLGIGSFASLFFAVLAETLLALFVTLGIFTRASLIPLIFTMVVAAFLVHGGDPVFGKPPSKEMALLFLAGYASLMISGAGRYSLDKLLHK